MDRASGCGPGGRRFDSCQAHHLSMNFRKAIQNDEQILRAYQNALNKITNTISDAHLPHPYVPASTGIFREQYYWDTFFIMQGLKEKGAEGMEIIKNMMENNFYLFNKFSLIPNASKSFTTRSQPPLLTSMILMVDDFYNDHDWLKKAFKIARQEYKMVWTSPLHLTKNSLSRYQDQLNLNGDAIDAENESGWDFTPRFRLAANHVCPIDLNALLYKYEKDFELIAKKLNRLGDAAKWKTRAETRREVIDEILWNEEQGFYFDYGYNQKKPLDTKSLAAYVPLWSNCANKKQAKQLADKLKWFEHKGGLTATDQNYGSDEQWSYPNGWPPLMWFTIKGLEKYGFQEDADRITYKWLKLCAKVVEESGNWHEKYSVVEGVKRTDDKRYPHQNQQYWTMGVFIDLCQTHHIIDKKPKKHISS